MRWTKVLTVGAAASLGFVAACGARRRTTAAPRARATATAARPTTAAAALEPERQGPGARRSPVRRRAASSRCPYARRPANMDPSDQFYQDTAVIFSLTHRALTTFVLRDGKQVLVPDLATDLGKASEDGLTWTFTLKDGIKYEDGTPVKAADIVFAAKRSFDPDLAARRPDLPARVLQGWRRLQGPLQG